MQRAFAWLTALTLTLLIGCSGPEPEPGKQPTSSTPAEEGGSGLPESEDTEPTAEMHPDAVGQDEDDFGIAIPDPSDVAEAEELEAPVHIGGDVRPPVLVSSVEPEYTEVARKVRIQGVVICQVVVRTDGSVSNIKVLKGLPMGLSEKAVKAFEQYRYEPATLHGEPIAVYFNVTANFRLQ